MVFEKQFNWKVFDPKRYAKKSRNDGQNKYSKNGQEQCLRENIKHLQYFNNGQWRHSDKCKQFVYKDCTVTIGNKPSDY